MVICFDNYISLKTITLSFNCNHYVTYWTDICDITGGLHPL